MYSLNVSLVLSTSGHAQGMNGQLDIATLAISEAKFYLRTSTNGFVLAVARDVLRFLTDKHPPKRYPKPQKYYYNNYNWVTNDTCSHDDVWITSRVNIMYTW